MSNERRVLAVPSTEDPTSPTNHRMKLADEYLEKALGVLKNTMNSFDEKVAWDAAKWVAEMVMGKPKQAIENEGGTEAVMARMLSLALAGHMKDQTALPPSIEGNVRILGGPQEAPIEAPVIEYVPKTKSFEFDDLPE